MMKYLVLILMLSNSLIFAWLKNTTHPRFQPLELATNLLDEFEADHCESSRTQSDNHASLYCLHENGTTVRIYIQWYTTDYIALANFYGYSRGGDNFHGYPMIRQRSLDDNHPREGELTETQHMRWQAKYWIIQVSTSTIMQDARGLQDAPSTIQSYEISEFIYKHIQEAGEFRQQPAKMPSS